MPHFTELNAETSLAYAHALAAVFGQTVASEAASRRDDNGHTYYVVSLSDGTEAAMWLEDGHVYGEA